jgi:hypothetical protein
MSAAGDGNPITVFGPRPIGGGLIAPSAGGGATNAGSEGVVSSAGGWGEALSDSVGVASVETAGMPTSVGFAGATGAMAGAGR